MRTALNVEIFYRANPYLKLYTGKKYSDNQKIFSFFPCKNGEQGRNKNKGFERPILDINTFCLQKPGAGQVCQDLYNKNEFSYNSIQDYWNTIVETILLDFGQKNIN